MLKALGLACVVTTVEGQGRPSAVGGGIEVESTAVRAVVDFIGVQFGAETNLAMATYYWNGREHYIPVHQDKKITTGSLGRVETASRIFNVSLGAVRPFLVTSLASLGKAERADMDILAPCSQETFTSWRATSTGDSDMASPATRA